MYACYLKLSVIKCVSFTMAVWSKTESRSEIHLQEDGEKAYKRKI